MIEEQQLAEIRKQATESAQRHFSHMAELLPSLSDGQRRILLLSIEGGFYDGLVIGSKSMGDHLMAGIEAAEAVARMRLSAPQP